MKALPLICLLALLLFACETLDLSEKDEASTEQSSSSDSTGSDDDYISDTTDFRGYGTLETYLKHYGTDSLHCIPLVDLLEGGCIYEAFYESTDNQTILATSARWVGAAVIVGYVSSTQLTANTAIFSASGAVQSNILIGPSADESDYTNCLPVQLSTSSNAMQVVRDACNLSDNPSVLGKNAKFYGKLQAYFGVIGLKSVTDYTFTNDTVLDWNATGDETLDSEEEGNDEQDNTEDEEDSNDDDATDEEDSSDDDVTSDDGDDSSTDDDGTSDDDTSSDDDDSTSEEDDDDSDSWGGYGSLDAYIAAYGNSYDNPVPLEDCLAGGCLYEYYTTDDDPAYYSNVWVGPGYIVGYLDRSISSCYFTADGAGKTNVLLAPSKSTTDPARCMPINLETPPSYADVRAAYNLSDNPDSLGVRVVFYGNFVYKYGTLSLTHVKDAVSLPQPTQPRHARRKEN